MFLDLLEVVYWWMLAGWRLALRTQRIDFHLRRRLPYNWGTTSAGRVSVDLTHYLTRVSAYILQEADQVVGVFLFHCEDALEHAS